MTISVFATYRKAWVGHQLSPSDPYAAGYFLGDPFAGQGLVLAVHPGYAGLPIKQDDGALYTRRHSKHHRHYKLIRRVTQGK